MKHSDIAVKKCMDMSGKTFGRWSVLSDYVLSDRGERKWLCRCTCGTERYVLERGLLYGGSVSCGCLRTERRQQALTMDLTGKVFGELTVVRRVESKKGSAGARWLCRCSCGEEYEVLGTLLVNGKRTRCPSNLHAKNYTYVDITGKRFGLLVALEPARRGDSSGSVIWRCRCDCGNEIEVSYNKLMYTNQKSCGCRKKEHNQKLNTFLTHVSGTSVDILKSKKIPADNTTGYRGVYWIRGKYVAKIVFQKKAYYLGAFDKIEEAVLARKEAEEILFDGTAAFYEKWKEKAEKDPIWAEKNPMQVLVKKDAVGNFDVSFLPTEIS